MKVRWGYGGAVGLLALCASFCFTGCDDCWDEDCGSCSDWNAGSPAVPVGLRTLTGDGEVYLDWYDVEDVDLAGYRIYVSDRADGHYESIGETRSNSFIDYEAQNGRTYFYAVTAFNHCGHESGLSYEAVHDTPRPEGYGLSLTSATARPSRSGYDFSEFDIQAPGEPGTDIYFRIEGGVPWMFAATGLTGIQDTGFFDLDALDWAPERGWSEIGRVELIEGHTYVVVTGDDHYAKFHVVSLSGDTVTFDWAYQVDRGNRELSVGNRLNVSTPDAAGSSGGKETGEVPDSGGEES